MNFNFYANILEGVGKDDIVSKIKTMIKNTSKKYTEFTLKDNDNEVIIVSINTENPNKKTTVKIKKGIVTMENSPILFNLKKPLELKIIKSEEALFKFLDMFIIDKEIDFYTAPSNIQRELYIRIGKINFKKDDGFVFFDDKEDIENWLNANGVDKFIIHDDLTVTSYSYVTLRDISGPNKIRYRKLPVKFREIKGSFWIDDLEIESIEGSPEIVGGNFDCSKNKLKSLIGGPVRVGGFYNCSGNQLTSLEGVAKEIFFDKKGNLGTINMESNVFDCHENNITSLIDMPKGAENLICHTNKLKSLEGIAKTVKQINCSSNEITTLKHISGMKLLDLYCFRNPITTFSDTKIEVTGEFGITPTHLKNIENIPMAENILSFLFEDMEASWLPIADKITKEHLTALKSSHDFKQAKREIPTVLRAINLYVKMLQNKKLPKSEVDELLQIVYDYPNFNPYKIILADMEKLQLF